MKEMEHLEVFEAYRAGRMEEIEKADFERRLEEDPVFRREWDIFQQLAAGAEAAGRQHARKMIREAATTYRQHTQRRKRRLLAGVALAAVLGIALAVGIWQHRQLETWRALALSEYKSPQHLLRQTLDAIESTGLANKQNDTTPQLHQGLLALESKSPDEAARLLSRTAVCDVEEEALARFFEGMAYMELGRYAAAIRSLERIPDGAPAPIADEARYQLAWAWAQRPFGQKKGVALLQTIAGDPGNSRQQDARRVLEQLY